MSVDDEPTRNLRDDRVRAAFAMAPGDIPGFGMDEAGLKQMAIPTYIIVGAGDSTTPLAENAAFAAKYIPHAQLDVLPAMRSSATNAISWGEIIILKLAITRPA